MSAPTPTALAAREFLARTSSPAYRNAIENAAILGGWAGARGIGVFDAPVSDAIAKAALTGVMDLFRSWAAEAGAQPAQPAPPDA